MEKFNVKNGLTVGTNKLSVLDSSGGLSATSILVNSEYSLPSFDGASGQAIITDGEGYLQFIQPVPAGCVTAFAGSSAPSGWLLCDGSAVNRTTYGALFSVIGTTYGVGDGTSTFNLPDLRGRVAAGKDDMDNPVGTGGGAAGRLTNSGTGNPGIDGTTLGASGGDDRHQLSEAQMPSHFHTFAITTQTNTAANGGATRVTNVFSGTGRNVASAGGDEAHPNVQPTIVLNYIIKI